MKIHIYGAPGSGKTTQALKYVEEYNIKHLDLDVIFWDHNQGNYNVIQDKEKRKKDLENFIKQNENWVIEGVYMGWVDNSLTNADYIIVLNKNMLTRNYRIIKRFVIRKITRENNRETFKSIYELVKWNIKYQKKFDEHLKYLKKHFGGKVIIKN